jgi:hypothetical protein
VAKRKHRRKLAAPERIEDMLDRAGDARFARNKPPIPIAAWRTAVGPRIAEKARPVALDRGVLTVRVASSAWANELSLLSIELVARLSAHGHDVKQIRFRVGAIEPVARPPERRKNRQVPPPAPLAPALAAEIDAVPDEELRAVLHAAARANLAWQRYVGSAAVREPPVTEGPRGAPGPRSAETGSAPPDRSDGDSDGAARYTRGGGSYRPR